MKAGVMLGDFFSQGVAQLDLFDDIQPQANSSALMHVVDEINKKGKGSYGSPDKVFTNPGR